MAKPIRIEIETAIRKLSWASFQAGQKSIQRITIDFEHQKIESKYTTGHTEILCLSLHSARDKFGVSGQRFQGHVSASFKATGSTASGVRLMPDIDYCFEFEVDPSTVRFSGAHDGYPSYNIAVNGTSVYDYVQGHIGQLLGTSDITVKSQVHPIR